MPELEMRLVTSGDTFPPTKLPSFENRLLSIIFHWYSPEPSITVLETYRIPSNIMVLN